LKNVAERQEANDDADGDGERKGDQCDGGIDVDFGGARKLVEAEGEEEAQGG
jgi:hypothetical protein